MNLWEFVDRNEGLAVFAILVIGLTITAVAGMFSSCETPGRKDERRQFIEQCVHTERSTDDCIKLSKEL